MRILKQRKQNRVSRRAALDGVPMLNPGVEFETLEDGGCRVSTIVKRGQGLFERLRPLVSRRAYELDAFGRFVVERVDGQRSVLEIVNAFETEFRMSRRETELAVVAFFKLLMQRNVLTVIVDRDVRPKAGVAALALLSSLLLAGVPEAQALAAGSAAETLSELRTLTEHAGGRHPGAPGNQAIEALVAERFAASDYESGEIVFRAPVLEPGRLTLDCGARGRFELDAMHPTLMRPGNFDTNTFTTRLVYLGKGGPEGLRLAEGIALENTLAVMDYDCGDAWLDLLRFGFDGFIFVGDGPSTHDQAVGKVYSSEVSVPRFFIDGDAGARLLDSCRGAAAIEATATAVPTRWRNDDLRDLWVLVPGADEVRAQQVVVFTAPMDAGAVVPARAQGAQRAINLHVLLKLLEDFKAQPPLYSVLLVAVNAHTQNYAGERALAWHLLGEETRVEDLRDRIAGEMRVARLFAREYGRLQLKPVPEAEKADLPMMMEVLWQVDKAQQELRLAAHEKALEAQEEAIDKRRDEGLPVADLEEAAPPELDEVLELSALGETELRAALVAAREKVIDDYSGFFASRGRDPREVAQEREEDLEILGRLEGLDAETFMAKARRIQHVFDDEKLFEAWRSKLDESTGRRVYVKGQLQDEFKSNLNRTMQQIMVYASTNQTQLSKADRDARVAELNVKREDLQRVLVLFNKIDIGVGRSRTYYRQIAVNDLRRNLLRDSVTKFVEKFTGWQALHAALLRKDVANGAVRSAVGTRDVALVVPLDLDAHGQRYGFSYFAPRAKGSGFDGFGKLCAGLAETLEAEAGTGVSYVDAISASTDQLPPYFFTQPDSAVYFFQVQDLTPAIALKSAFTGPGAVFGPYDTVDRLDAEHVHALQQSVRRFLGAILAQEDILSAQQLGPMDQQKNLYLWSAQTRTYALEQFSGKPIPTTEVPGSIVTIYDRSYPPNLLPTVLNGDVLNAYMALSDQTANAYFYGLATAGKLAPLGYQMDADFREVIYAMDRGRVQSSKQINSNVQRSDRITLPMFECREFVIADRRDPTLLGIRDVLEHKYWPKNGQGQSDPEKYGLHGAGSLSPSWTHAAAGPVGVYLYNKTAGFVQDTLMVITAHKRCVLNTNTNTIEGTIGEGFESQEAMGSDFYLRAAEDMATLNTARNAGMKGVVNQLVDEFLVVGDRLNTEARESLAQNRHMDFLLKHYEALGAEVKAYGEILQMNADMLKAIVVYMALMLPFCFFMQKLIFNFTKLEHELAGFSVLFLCMYLIFRFIHPAFQLAMSPEAIFIAFVLGAIGCFTTSVLNQRFSGEMQVLLRGIGGIGESASYSTVGQTAMLIGVQNMRRRRVRTLLTTATIVLVVFTMLAFSSVSRKAKPTLIKRSDAAMYTGLFYHWPAGLPMDEHSERILRDIFAGRAEIQTRRLMKAATPWRLERTDDPEAVLKIKAITGLPPADRVLEASLALVEGTGFSSPHAHEILLPQSVADALGIGSADVGQVTVNLLGRTLVVRGLLSDQRYQLARDLNPNLPLVPMGEAPKRKKDKAAEETLEVEIHEISELLMDTAELVIVPEGLAAELGARPCSVSVIFPPDTSGEVLGAEMNRLLTISDAKFFLGSQKPFRLDAESSTAIKSGVYYVGSSYRTAIGGLARLIIPLIIAGSIILNTMLGTVYERKSEIAVFNAIGLNPTHIFLFFLAEAIVYSFIGSVGGYLIGQVLTVVLKSAGLIRDVNINFSSLMVVYAILFTMTLVILSTLYPGYVATRTAVPSGKRKWSMPPVEGDRMSVVFPFIYRPRMAFGAMSYLHTFLEKFSEQSAGEIIAAMDGVEEHEDDDGRLVLKLRYTIALAPYDLGVTQRVTFTTRYDEVVRSFRLHMEIQRISGRDTNWVTTNKPFLERMRKHLIRWRNVDPTRQAWFVDQAAGLFKTPPPAAPVVEAKA